MNTNDTWYVASMGSDPFNQGLVASEKTGENIAVTYKAENAPIVAAAPELLEALKAAYQWIENIYHLPNGEGTGILSKTMPDPREIGIDTMRDAIRKAEGER